MLAACRSFLLQLHKKGFVARLVAMAKSGIGSKQIFLSLSHALIAGPAARLVGMKLVKALTSTCSGWVVLTDGRLADPS